ncbi:MAG: hypothetical protein RID91_03105 [Azospirillaceae bacterium]
MIAPSLPILDPLARALALLGRQAPWVLPASLALGAAVPSLADLARPALPPVIFLILGFALMRVAPARAVAAITRARTLVAVAWQQLALPLAAVAVLAALQAAVPGLPRGVLDGATVFAFSAPVLSTIGLALLLRLDAPTATALLIAGGATSVMILPGAVDRLAPGAADLGAAALGLRLAALVGGAALMAAAVRRVFGAGRVEAAGPVFDGVFVILMVIFGLAAMDGVGPRLIARPGETAVYLVVALGLAALLAAGGLAMRPVLGAGAAGAAALCSGLRNMGLTVAAAGASVSDDVFLFFGLVQIPIYAVPAIGAALARRRDLVGSSKKH